MTQLRIGSSKWKLLLHTYLWQLHLDTGHKQNVHKTFNLRPETRGVTPFTAQKWSFLLRISSINVSKSAVSSGFGHIYWKILNGMPFALIFRQITLHSNYIVINVQNIIKMKLVSQFILWNFASIILFFFESFII